MSSFWWTLKCEQWTVSTRLIAWLDKNDTQRSDDSDDDLKVSVDQVVDLEILVVVAPRIEKSFGYLDPTKVTDELKDAEPRDEDTGSVSSKSSLMSEAVVNFTNIILRAAFAPISFCQKKLQTKTVST